MGFSVATCVWHDILVIDEALSVGDSQFREKCFAKIREFRERGASILLVLNNLQIIRDMCPRTLWLNEGEIRANGPSEQFVAQYYPG